MEHNKWIFDKTNNRIVTEDDKENILYTDKFTCPNYVLEHVVFLHNTFEDKEIDNFLLFAPCSQEEREEIMEIIPLN